MTQSNKGLSSPFAEAAKASTSPFEAKSNGNGAAPPQAPAGAGAQLKKDRSVLSLSIDNIR